MTSDDLLVLLLDELEENFERGITYQEVARYVNAAFMMGWETGYQDVHLAVTKANIDSLTERVRKKYEKV